MIGRYRVDVSSVTNAMRGRSLLERNGIAASVERKLDPSGGNGCGYSLVVNADPERAIRLLSANGIRVRGGHTETTR